MFHEQNFKRVFPKQQTVKLFSSSTQPFKCIFVFCISNTFVKSISQSILKYFLQLYFVFCI